MDDGSPDNYGPLWFARKQAEAREAQALRRVQRRWHPTQDDEWQKDNSEGDTYA